MKSSLQHIQLHIDYSGIDFYKELFLMLGWKIVYEGEEMIGLGDSQESSIWFSAAPHKKTQDHDAIGLNHIGIRVSKLADVNKVAEFLEKKDIELLFETPRHRPEFSEDDTSTYYQVMFKYSDNILFEVVYIGKR